MIDSNIEIIVNYIKYFYKLLYVIGSRVIPWFSNVEIKGSKSVTSSRSLALKKTVQIKGLP